MNWRAAFYHGSAALVGSAIAMGLLALVGFDMDNPTGPYWLSFVLIWTCAIFWHELTREQE